MDAVEEWIEDIYPAVRRELEGDAAFKAALADGEITADAMQAMVKAIGVVVRRHCRLYELVISKRGADVVAMYFSRAWMAARAADECRWVYGDEAGGKRDE